MKRSKIFLGVTTCLLAVAGAFASKAGTNKFIAATFYTSAGTCVQYTAPDCNNTATAICKTANNVKTLYTSQDAGVHCRVPLHKTL